MKPFAKPLVAITGVLIVVVGISACATGPNIAEMRKLNGEEVAELLAGNTLTFKTDYGRWTQTYSTEDLSGNGRASGSFGVETAASTVAVSDDGEFCSQFSAAHDWSTPEHKYCDELYIDDDGVYAMKQTVNTRRPKRVGQINKAEIQEGDPSGLNGS